MHEILKASRDIIDYGLVVTLIIIGLLMLIIDGSRYSKGKYEKELKLVRIISYSYIAFGVIVSVLLIIF